MKYRDSDRGARFDLGFTAGDGEDYTYRGWVSPYVPDDMDSPRTARDLTQDVIEAALEGIIDDVDAEVEKIKWFDLSTCTKVRAYHDM